MQKQRESGFTPILIAVGISILAILGYVFMKNYQNPGGFSSTQFPLNTSNRELIDFVKAKTMEGCISEIGRDDCKENVYVVGVEEVKGDYAHGALGVEGGAGWLWAAAKKNGEWDYLLEVNGISDCKDVEIFPAGIFDNWVDKCIKDDKLFDKGDNKFVE